MPRSPSAPVRLPCWSPVNRRCAHRARDCLPTVAWQHGDATAPLYALDGGVYCAGSAIEWAPQSRLVLGISGKSMAFHEPGCHRQGPRVRAGTFPAWPAPIGIAAPPAPGLGFPWIRRSREMMQRTARGGRIPRRRGHRGDGPTDTHKRCRVHRRRSYRSIPTSANSLPMPWRRRITIPNVCRADSRRHGAAGRRRRDP